MCLLPVTQWACPAPVVPTEASLPPLQPHEMGQAALGLQASYQADPHNPVYQALTQELGGHASEQDK